jgi:zinc transporter 2
MSRSDHEGLLRDPLLVGRRVSHRHHLGPRSVSACVLAEGTTDVEKQNRQIKMQRKLIVALLIAAAFMAVELAGGIYAHSLAIMTDAAHLLSDVSGFAVSLFAAIYAAKRSGEHFSYGYHRVEVLGALASVLTVWLVTGVLVWEAVGRIVSPEPVNGKVMFILALVGVGVNVLLMAILGGHGHSHGAEHGHHDHLDGIEAGGEGLPQGNGVAQNHDDGHHHDHVGDHHEKGSEGNINMRGAIIHVLGDLVQSVGVAIAGALIWWHQDDPRWALADPVCTFLFAILVLWTTVYILRDVSDVLMERAPRGVEVGEIAQALLTIQGVSDVHDLHIWSLTLGIPLLCAHVVLTPGADPAQVLHRVTDYCRASGIDHTTIQLVMEGNGGCPCGAIDPIETNEDMS